ncbi:MAG TPA: 1-phosphofructokinase [Fimbriimonadaceae bacterium]|nr:1-phosphofructokinase [Fimbriimonadaceae bacterium]
MILTVTLNPSVDHALFIEHLKVGDTNRVKRTERDAGGKGVNLARVAAELGAQTVATGFLGGGPGAYVRRVLERQGVQHRFIEVAGETRINFSVEDADKNPPTTFNEQGPEITAAELQELIAQVEELAPHVEWLAMGGSLPPGVPDDIFARLTEIGRRAGCKTVVDADGEPMKLALEARPNMIKPNHKEAARLLGRPVESTEEAVGVARELLNALDQAYGVAVVSRGADGAVLAHQGGVLLAQSPEVQVRSTIGSGDSMIGGILFALMSGMSLEEAFRWGIAAGAATATTDGSEIARRPVVLELLERVRIEAVD